MTDARIKAPYKGRSYGDLVHEALAASSIPPGAEGALVALDMALFQLMRHVVKADLVVAYLKQGDSGLEPAVFQGLTAVLRVAHGVGRAGPGEPTVGSIAEELNIDPSRASRIAAALIEKGYVRRLAAQEDGRKSVLEVTPQGWALLHGFFRFKWQRLVRVFEGWTEEEITTFSRLLTRYAGQIAGLSAEGT
ncbi:MAG: winged helix-turn-helix transcriptional regulator [Pseudooceanicola sp.]|nr:winged helix-turn-helix transcriptional regulator [Pseudooceanicola sp.]